MKKTPTNKYSEIVEQCKQAETIIILSADLILAEQTLSQKAKELLETIKKQTWRIDRELNKAE
jgi:serine phosphatase RsbU (regulator of sigma subunit)